MSLSIAQISAAKRAARLAGQSPVSDNTPTLAQRIIEKMDEASRRAQDLAMYREELKAQRIAAGYRW